MTDRVNPGADPAFDYRGLLWNFRRIGLPQGWRTTAGRPAVTVGVADTGPDFTHAELRPRVQRVTDLTQTEEPPICEEFFRVSDQELAARFGGPARTDWNGHGTWIGGNIAAALNGTGMNGIGMNGIAPRVGLVSLKISQWCGFAYVSTILAAFLTAANARMDVVSLSFGGYLDRSAPGGNLLYRLYADTVAFARSQGTTIVASASHEHVRIGAGGRVVSHGSLTPPGGNSFDLFGWYQLPGGIPRVVNVPATNNVVNGRPGVGHPAPRAPWTIRTRPATRARSPLAPDIAAPGGARKRVKAHAVDRVNRTPGLSRTDRSPGDLIRQPRRTGFCHLGGPAIPSGEAYGAGLLDVARP